MTAPIFIASGAVADLLGYRTRAGFLAERPALERDLAFPPPYRLHPLRWRRDDVVAWRSRVVLETARAELAGAPTDTAAAALFRLARERVAVDPATRALLDALAPAAPIDDAAERTAGAARLCAIARAC